MNVFQGKGNGKRPARQRVPMADIYEQIAHAQYEKENTIVDRNYWYACGVEAALKWIASTRNEDKPMLQEMLVRVIGL